MSASILHCVRVALISAAALAVAVVFADNAHAGLFGPSTPKEKLAEAQYLAEGPGRIFRARQRIEEARAECEKTGDKSCLAEVWRLYGLLERAGATKDVAIMYGGINAGEPKKENLDRAEPYFLKAIEYATEAGDYSALANLNYLMMVNQKYKGTPQNGCPYVDAFLKAAGQYQQAHPNDRMDMPPQFKTREEWAAAARKELGCPAT